MKKLEEVAEESLKGVGDGVVVILVEEEKVGSIALGLDLGKRVN